MANIPNEKINLDERLLIVKVWIESYGCATNQGDASIMKGILEERRHKLTEMDEADALILVTCNVVATTEQRMLHRLHLFKETGKPIIVAGCMASTQPNLIKKVIPEAKLLQPKYLHHIADVVEGKEIKFFYKPKVGLPRHFGIKMNIPIAEGCPFSCSYCITKLARGKLRSYPIDGLINDISIAIKKGCKEIRLTSQDTASYGMDIGENLSSLLHRCCQIKGNFRIRIGMMNPSSIGNIEDLLDIYKNKKIYKFLHLPVQSGSNEILKKMNRSYKVKDFIDLVKRFRKEFLDSTISTDIIVAFPSETRKQFEKSCSLIQKVNPDIINITRFSARPGTRAKKMKPIDTKIAKDRSRKMTSIVNKISYEKNKSKIGKIYEVLLLEKKDGWIIGKASNYKSVFIKDENNEYSIGDFLNVKIKDVATTHLIGKS